MDAAIYQVASGSPTISGRVKLPPGILVIQCESDDALIGKLKISRTETSAQRYLLDQNNAAIILDGAPNDAAPTGQNSIVLKSVGEWIEFVADSESGNGLVWFVE